MTTPSSRRRADGVEVDATIQQNALNLDFRTGPRRRRPRARARRRPLSPRRTHQQKRRWGACDPCPILPNLRRR